MHRAELRPKLRAYSESLEDILWPPQASENRTGWIANHWTGCDRCSPGALLPETHQSSPQAVGGFRLIATERMASESFGELDGSGITRLDVIAADGRQCRQC